MFSLWGAAWGASDVLSSGDVMCCCCSAVVGYCWGASDILSSCDVSGAVVILLWGTAGVLLIY